MGGRYSTSNTDNTSNKNVDIVPGGGNSTDNNFNNTKNTINNNTNEVTLNYNNHNSISHNQQTFKKIGEDLVKKVNINYIAKITSFDLNKSFHSNAIDNSYLDRECFNKSIKQLLGSLNLPTLANTHLSDKLFDMVDTSGDGRISKEEFNKGMAVVLGDNEMGKRCKFYLII